MTETSTSPVRTQPQVPIPEDFPGIAARLLPWWSEATPEQQHAVLEDMALAHADGLAPKAYCEQPQSLADHLACVNEERQQRGLPPIPAPAAAVPAQVQIAEEHAAEEEAKARDQADSTLKATVRAYRKGEHAYRAGLLESGRLADHYLHQRMAPPIRDKRAPAVQTLEGELAKWSSTTVDVNRLIGCAHAYRLLAVEPGLEKAAESIPYGHYRDAWMQLVQRVDKDTPQEHWVLLPGVELEARQLFGECCQHRRSKEAVSEGVKGLLRVKVDRDAVAARAEADQARVTARERAEVEARAQAEAAAAEQATAVAEQAVQEAQESDKATLTEAADHAKAELLAKQTAAIAAAEATAKAEQTKARAEADAHAAQQAAAKAAEKAAKASAAATEKAKAKARPEPAADECRQPAMKAMAKAGTAKDVAALAVELIAGSDAPDDVLAELLRQLKACGQCSKHALRAIDAALVVFHRPAAGASVTSSAAA